MSNQLQKILNAALQKCAEELRLLDKIYDEYRAVHAVDQRLLNKRLSVMMETHRKARSKLMTDFQKTIRDLNVGDNLADREQKNTNARVEREFAQYVKK